MSNTRNGSDQWKKPKRALRQMGSGGKQGKHDVVFMPSTHFKRKQRGSEGEMGEWLCDRQGQLHNLQSPVQNENAGPLVHKTGKKLLLNFAICLWTSPWCFHLLVNVALSWKSRPHSFTPQLATCDALQLQPSHPMPTPCSLTVGEGRGTTHRCLSVCPRWYQGWPPPEARLQVPHTYVIVPSEFT